MNLGTASLASVHFRPRTAQPQGSALPQGLRSRPLQAQMPMVGTPRPVGPTLAHKSRTRWRWWEV